MNKRKMKNNDYSEEFKIKGMIIKRKKNRKEKERERE